GRTDYSKEEQKEAKSLYSQLQLKILDVIKTVLSSSENKESEFEGAEDFLPDDSSNVGDKSNSHLESEDNAIIRKRKKKRNFDLIGYDTDYKGESLQPDLGLIDDNGENLASVPEGYNENDGGGNRPGINEENLAEGNDETLRIVSLSGIKPRF